MYSIFLVFIWRRKIVILSLSILLLLGIWLWTIHDDKIIRGERIFLIGNIKYGAVQAAGVEKSINAKAIDFGELAEGHRDSLHFFRTTVKNPHKNSIELKENLNQLSALLSNKDAVKVLQNVERQSHEIGGRRKPKAERAFQSSSKTSKYNRELQKMGIPIVNGLRYHDSKHVPNHRLVHLDLKGAPPKVSYLKRLFPMLKTLGATGILIEYEDMFPFEHPIQKISAKNCYSHKEIRDLLQSATASGLTVIPLIQIFGHMEFALKLHDYEHLREASGLPQSICPSFNESHNFLQTMITQIMEAHKKYLHPPDDQLQGNDSHEYQRSRFTHIHIGCDEVYQIGECVRCQSKQKNVLFLNHVKTLATFIRSKWPRTKVIIWDDMLRQIPTIELEDSSLGDLVEPMIWAYAENVDQYVSNQIFAKYSRVFPTIWTASAFKGAYGESLVIPPLRRHLENNLNWLALMRAQSVHFTGGIQGIALTGWQRYDHFASLCELLPVSLPSLALCLITVTNGYFETDVRQNHLLSALTCPEPSQKLSIHHPWINLNRDTYFNSFTKCMFVGSSTLRFAVHLVEISTETREYLDDVKYKRGWLTPYHIKHNFSSPARVEQQIEEAGRLKNTLTALVNDAKDAMAEVYDEWTIREFVEQTINPLIVDLEYLQKETARLMSINSWPRRPL